MNNSPKKLLVRFICVLVVSFVAGCANPQLPSGETAIPDQPTAPNPDPEPPAKPDATVGTVSIVIDFDSSVPGIAEDVFTGSGFGLSPEPGQLDSDAWSILGFSDGDLAFGEEASTGDAARGKRLGGVSTGGLYAFTVTPENQALGVQPTSTDFAPGSIILRTVVPVDNVIDLKLETRLWTLNDQNRSTLWSTWYSFDGIAWVELVGMDLATPAAADISPEWIKSDLAVGLPMEGLSLGTGDMVYIRWDATDGEGDGSRDESAIDDVRLTYTFEE